MNIKHVYMGWSRAATLVAVVMMGAMNGLAQPYIPEEGSAELSRNSRAQRPTKVDPNLPNVLIIGDSISIGYTGAVSAKLAGKANVIHNPGNAEGTKLGLQKLKEWLGDTKWDVIHFNWGLHDMKSVKAETGENSNDPNDPRQADLETYTANLEILVKQLKATGAKLIFATTTPFPAGVKPFRLPEDAARYNAAALGVIRANNIQVNDLYQLVLPKLNALQMLRNVHFNQEGSKVLGEQVAHVIQTALGEPQARASQFSSTLLMTSYGKLPDGREAQLYTITNKNGMVAKVTDYGALLVGLEVPDAKGKVADVTLGYDTLDGWLTNTSYFGATAGRFANRIARGKFTLDGVEYTLAKNNEPGGIPCHLHGGNKGFDKVLWKGRPLDIAEGRGVKLTYISKNGEEGYPGNLTTTITYLLTDANELVWEAEATTDSPTVVNLVHHSYWNLSGNPKSSINDHEMMLAAPGYLPTDAGLIPTGKIEPVAGTPMDFTKSTRIGDRVDADFEALRFAGGYDHCWVLEAGRGMKLAARVKDPKSGRVMEILTDQPGIQFYGGNFLDGTVKGKGGVEYARRSGLCLETEGFPDAPNQPTFPSAVLRPGETYRHKMVHRFSVE